MIFIVSQHLGEIPAAGTGVQQIGLHADADDCKHISVSHAETCSICSFYAGRAIFASTPFVFGYFKSADNPQPINFVSSYSTNLISATPRRGPPSSYLFV
jgi:hypothetical protein